MRSGTVIAGPAGPSTPLLLCSTKQECSEASFASSLSVYTPVYTQTYPGSYLLSPRMV